MFNTQWIKKIQEKYPDMRTGQIISNAMSERKLDLFHASDEMIEEALLNYAIAIRLK
jgi:hypothetical protein